MPNRAAAGGDYPPLVEHLANALYEETFDPRCDSEGAVWDDAVSIATKVATRFEQVGFMATSGDGLLPSVGRVAAVWDRPIVGDRTLVPIYRAVQSGSRDGSDV